MDTLYNTTILVDIYTFLEKKYINTQQTDHIKSLTEGQGGLTKAVGLSDNVDH